MLAALCPIHESSCLALPHRNTGFFDVQVPLAQNNLVLNMLHLPSIF